MLKYNIKENISKEAILYLRTLDNEFADDLKAFLNKEKYSNIIVKYDILVQDSTNESNVYHVSCNASSSIPESYNVARAIDVFLNNLKSARRADNVCFDSKFISLCDL